MDLGTRSPLKDGAEVHMRGCAFLKLRTPGSQDFEQCSKKTKNKKIRKISVALNESLHHVCADLASKPLYIKCLHYLLNIQHRFSVVDYADVIYMHRAGPG